MLWAIPSVFAAASNKNNLIEKKTQFPWRKRERNTLTLYDMQGINTLIKAIDSVGDPPLPIPNREVKPDSADGTAKICGRVGHRHFYLEALNESLGLLFLLSHLARVVLVIHYIADMTCIVCNYSTKLLPLVAKHSSKLGVSLAYPQHCGRVVA